MFARYAVSMLVAMPWYFVTLIFEKTDVDNPWVLLFFAKIIPYFMFYFSMFALGDPLNRRIGIL